MLFMAMAADVALPNFCFNAGKVCKRHALQTTPIQYSTILIPYIPIFREEAREMVVKILLLN